MKTFDRPADCLSDGHDRRPPAKAPELVMVEDFPRGKVFPDEALPRMNRESEEEVRLAKRAIDVALRHPARDVITPRDLPAALAAAAEGFPSWDVLDAAHMLVASLIVDLVPDNERAGFLRKMDRVLRERVKEIGARQKPALVV